MAEDKDKPAKKPQRKGYRRPANHRGLTPKKVAMVVEMATTGVGVSEAARRVGLNPSSARAAVINFPELKEAVQRATDAPKAVLRDWLILGQKAQDKMERLLDSKDDKVAFLAARDILDRCLGKPTEKRETHTIRENRFSIDSDTMHAALTLSALHGWSLAASLDYARRYPGKTAEWLEGPTTGEGPETATPPPLPLHALPEPSQGPQTGP